MANGLGIASGLTGFAEGFAKAFTRRKEIESEQKNRADNFVTEQLIKGALNDPQAVVESPELMQDLEKRLGPQGSVFTQFLQHHAQRVQEDSLGAFLGAPEVGQQPAQAAAPEAQMIAPAPVGTGTVLAPNAPQAAQPAIPTVQPGAVPAPGETVRMAQPPKSRAQRLQEQLRPGQTANLRFGKVGLTLSGAEAQATKGYQYFYEERGQGLDDVTAAENTQARIVAEGGVPPKFIDDLASSRTKTEIAVNRANAIEAGKRGVATAHPSTEQEFRTAAAEGLINGQTHGRSLDEQALATVDTLNASGSDYVFQILPDGTYISQPREDALLSGRQIINPSTYKAQLAASRISQKQGPQQLAIQQIRNAVNELLTPGPDGLNALSILEPARPGEAGATSRFRAETQGRYRVWDLAQKGDPKAVALENFGALGIAMTRAAGSSANASDKDREAMERLTRLSSGGIPRQRAEADLNWLMTVMLPQLSAEGLLGDDGGGVTNREGTDRANTTNSTTSTTLPYNAKVIP